MTCGILGMDWKSASLSAYFETLAAHNAANDPDAKAGPRQIVTDPDRLRRFSRAHGIAA